MHDREPVKITIEGLTEDQVKSALGNAGLTGYSVEIVPLPSTENLPLSEELKESIVQGYLSFNEFAAYTASIGGVRKSENVRIWNSLHRSSMLMFMPNDNPMAWEDHSQLVLRGVQDVEIFKIIPVAERGSELGSYAPDSRIAYKLNLDGLDFLSKNSVLHYVPGFGRKTQEFINSLLERRQSLVEELLTTPPQTD